MAEKLPQLTHEFREFLVEAKINGYGSENAVKTRLDSGVTEIVYEMGDWRYADSYVGGNPYTGYENVAIKQSNGIYRPVWAMSYRGIPFDPNISDETLGKLLGEFLAKPDQAMPIRGPLNAWDKPMKHRYRLTYASLSSLENFEAGEQIYRDNRVIYSARFLGGLVNRDNLIEQAKPKWLVGE